MASLISDAQKAKLQGIMDNVHDTFARTIKVFKDGKCVVLSQNPGYSHIYKNASQSVTVSTLETTISARILYFPRHLEDETLQMSSEDYVKLAQAAAIVRIKIKKTDADTIKGAERVILDGTPFEIISAEIPHGLFGSGFITFILKRTS